MLSAITKREHRYFASYVLLSWAVMIFTVLLQNFRYGTFGTGLLLGWDSPGYVWSARYIITKGLINMIYLWRYPHLYTVFLAFLGYLNGDIIAIERVLPLLFSPLLVYANGKIVQRITQNINIAGIASLLTATSLNVLRVLSDLNRNFMALTLTSVIFLQISSLDYKSSFFNRRYLYVILVLLVIASTQFETFFVLSLSLILYGILLKNLKKLAGIVLACAVPIVILLLLFPTSFFEYTSTVVIFHGTLAFDEIIRWTGGSIVLLGFLIIGAVYTFYKAAARRDKLALLVFCWFSIIVLLVISLQFLLSTEFSRRTLLIMPVPILLALSTAAFVEFVKSKYSERIKLSKLFLKRKCLVLVNFDKLIVSLVVLCLIVGTVVTAVLHIDIYFSPFISRSSYEKIIIAKDLLIKNNLSIPIVVFRGDPPIWFVTLYRNYLGSELDEHFAYYGDLEKLFHLVSSEPKINYNAYLSELERFCLSSYYNELVGNYSILPPMYVHESHITSIEDLLSYPILVVTPDFYNDNIPYFMKPFYLGDGIYIILPHSSINLTEVFYGPEISVCRDSVTSDIKSEYSHIDPYDPSLVYLKLNASFGYQSYNLTNLTNLPFNLTFAWMEQGGDLSYPEQAPTRLDGTEAVVGNDPTESLQRWTTPTAEQEATFQTDIITKKEGNSSLKITGKTDSSGNLAIRYQPSSPLLPDLHTYTHISVWAKATEPVTFSITITDTQNKTRTYWDIKATDNRSATTNWKRLTANLNNYTSQTPGFDIAAIKHIDFYVYSTPNKNITFWIDDPTTDAITNLNEYIYKDRVPTNETLIIYFYTIDTSNAAETDKNNPS